MKAIDAEHYLIQAKLDRNSKLPNEYPFNLPVVRNFTKLEFHPKVTFFVGENGSGKSTLIEALAVGMGFNPEGGSKNFNFSTKDSHSRLNEELTLVKGVKLPRDGYFLRAESFYNVASHIDKLDEGGGGAPIKFSYGGASLHDQSHGESFMSLIMHRFGGKGLYLLDEPEAALSPSRQFAMLSRIKQLCDQDSQFIVATHSPVLLAYPEAAIYQITDDDIQKVNYKETEHYKLTKLFLDNPERMLNKLLNNP